MEFAKGRKAVDGDADVAVFFEPDVVRVEVRRGEIVHEARVCVVGVHWWRQDNKEMLRRALARRGMLHLRNYVRDDPLVLEEARSA